MQRKRNAMLMVITMLPVLVTIGALWAQSDTLRTAENRPLAIVGVAVTFLAFLVQLLSVVIGAVTRTHITSQTSPAETWISRLIGDLAFRRVVSHLPGDRAVVYVWPTPIIIHLTLIPTALGAWLSWLAR